MSEVFRHIGLGEFPSAHEYNRLVDAVSGLLKSSGVQYFSDSRGVHVRRMPDADGKTKYSLGFHGGGTSLPVATNTLTTIPIDFTISDPDGWLDSDGFVVPYDGMYFASAAFYIATGINYDVTAYVLGRNITGSVSLLKGVPDVTVSSATGLNFMLFHINGMVKLDKDDLFQYMFWHEAGGGNTMEVSNSLGAHAGLWLIERM